MLDAHLFPMGFTKFQMRRFGCDQDLEENKDVAIEILELLSDENGTPSLGSSDIVFHRADHALLNSMAHLSTPIDCRTMVFVELPPGFVSSTRFPDSIQVAVVLNGVLRIAAGNDERIYLKQHATSQSALQRSYLQ